MHPILRKTALAALLLATVPARAAILVWNFSGELDSGHFTGATYSGSFSYDDATLTGIGDEWLSVDNLTMSFLGNTYSLADADVDPEVGYFNGAFLGLSYSVSTSDPEFSLIPGSDDASDAFFAYDPIAGESGAGNVRYAQVPEPETLSLLLMGLGLVGLQLRKKQRTRKTLEKLENA